jgi:GMP synthase (glutamine-hydrolysing)
LFGLRVLLLQIRDAGDPMAEHEQRCIERRLENRSVELVCNNGLVERASAAWLDGVDALIVGGSAAYSVHHPRSAPWVDALRKLLDAALERNLPSFGICFGHQLLAYHLGAPVITDEERAEVGTIDVTLTEAGSGDPLFEDCEPILAVHTGHSDLVAAIPHAVDLLGASDTVETQIFRVRGACFYSTQFHPDLTGAEAIARYTAYKQSMSEALSPEVAHAVSRFRPGSDAAALLLGRFLDLVAQPKASVV